MDTIVARMNWRSEAAYLYVFELDALGLAWEYLRRNARYGEEAQHVPVVATAWHLHTYEDPCSDARVARPDWIPLAPCILKLMKSDDPSARLFSIWRLPGVKTFYRNGKDLLLTVRTGAQTWRLLQSPALCNNNGYAYDLRGGVDPFQAASMMSKINACMSPRRRRTCRALAAAFRPGRDLVVHFRTLRALDAQAVGASHREIAEALFGERDVWERWAKDGELRSYIRFLLRRGRRLVEGGYCRLFT